MGGSVGGSLFGSEGGYETNQAGTFQPFSYKSLIGTARGDVTDDGYQFSQELSPELQALYGYGQAQAQPFLSQYLQQAQAPVEGFDFTADPRAREAEIFQQQSDLLRPELARQQIQAQERMFGTGRLGLKLSGESVGAGAGTGMVNPDAYQLGLSQSRAIAELAPQARQMAQAEQKQAFDQARLSYALNQGAQQQQLENLLGGYGQAFGTVKNVYGLESGLITDAARREEARASANRAATTYQEGSGGLLGAAASAGLDYAMGGMGGGAGGGMFSTGLSNLFRGGAPLSPIDMTQTITPNFTNTYAGGTTVGNNFFRR